MQTNDRDPHIFLIEDDNEDILFFQLAVRSLPFAVLLTTAENGLRLVEMLEEALPDVIFLDNFMPYKSGQECIRDIRSNKKYDSIPIIIYTSHKSPQLAETSYRNGANLYVLKPRTIRELVEKIQMILKMDWSNSILFQHLGGSELSS
jgi:CheY-like chemotaxis protein